MLNPLDLIAFVEFVVQQDKKTCPNCLSLTPTLSSRLSRLSVSLMLKVFLSFFLFFFLFFEEISTLSFFFSFDYSSATSLPGAGVISASDLKAVLREMGDIPMTEQEVFSLSFSTFSFFRKKESIRFFLFFSYFMSLIFTFFLFCFIKLNFRLMNSCTRLICMVTNKSVMLNLWTCSSCGTPTLKIIF